MKLDLRDLPVIWINLDSATENSRAMEALLSSHGFLDTRRKSARVIEAPPDTPKELAHYVGCGQSHWEILADQSLETPFLVLEDDVEFTEDFQPVLRIPRGTDALYLGVSIGNPAYESRRWDEDHLRISGVLAAHAVLYLSEQFRNAMAEICNLCIHHWHRPWDVGSAMLQHRFQVLTPNRPFFYQANERNSSNKWEHLTRVCLEDRRSERLR